MSWTTGSNLGYSLSAVALKPAGGTLLGHWKFDEGSGQTAADSSGNGNNGMLGTSAGADSGDPTWACVTGGYALNFDGSNDEVKLPNQIIGDSAAWTISAWIKMGPDTADQRTIYSEGNTSAGGYLFLYVDDTNNHVRFYSDNGSNWAQIIGSTNVEDNLWHHVVMVQRSKTDRELYVDGTSQGTSTQNAGTLSHNTASIGYLRTDWVADPFKGSIDDVRVYNYGLSTAEITALGASPPTACGSTSTISSAASQSFAVGQAAALASTMTVTDAATPTITAAQDLRIRIPAALNMTWDTAVTTVTLGGGAAGKVSATGVTYEDGNKTAVLNVTSDFAASDQVTIADLKFANFTAASSATSLELVVAGSGGAAAATDDKTIDIAAAATLSSAANQAFTVGQAAAVASTLTVTDSSTPAITTSSDIRIRIPAALNMVWDTSVTSITAGGGASSKVSATGVTYEDSDKTAVINVTTNFAASDVVTIAGLKFTNFTATSAADNLELVVAGSGGATAGTDDKTITIDPAAGIGGSSVTSIADSSDLSAYSFPSATYSNNVLYIAFTATTCKSAEPCEGATGAPKVTSLSGAGLNFTEIGTAGGVDYAGSPVGDRRIQAWHAYVTSGAGTGVVTATLDGLSYSMGAVILAFTGTKTTGVNGADAIANYATNTGSGTSLQVNMAAFASSNNRPVAFFTHRANEVTDPETGYTELWDGSTSSLLMGHEAEWHATSAETTPSASWASSVSSGGFAVELAYASGTSAALSSATNQTFTVGQAAAAASTLTVTDGSTPAITSTQDLRIRIPAALNMTWDSSVTSVTLGGGASSKVSSSGITYEDSGKTAVLNVTSDFTASDVVTIAGLKFTNFTAASAASNLELVVAGSGGATAATDDKTITINASGGSCTATVYSTAQNATTYVVPTGATSLTVKAWGAGGGGGGQGNTGNGGAGGGGGFAQADITVTPGESLTITIGGGGNGGANNGGAGGGGSGVTAAGGGTGGDRADADSGGGGGGGGYSAVLRSGTYLVQAGGGGGGGGGGKSGSTGAGGPGGGSNGGNGTSAGGVGGGGGTASAGGAVGASSGTGGSSGSANTGGNGKTDTGNAYGGGGGGGGGRYGGGGGGASSVETSGGGGGGGGSSLVTGTSTVQTAGSGTSAGNNGDSDYASAAGQGGASNGGNGNPGRIVLIPGAGCGAASTLSSAANQTFTVGQAAAAASTLTVTDASTPTITSTQDLRIRIPAALNMIWDTSASSVTLGGGAASKVSSTGITYEDSGKTAVINVTTNFAASDVVTIAGLKFTTFTAASAANNLQLVTAGSGGATAATDDKTVTISAPGTSLLSSAVNQTFNVGQAAAVASTLTVTDAATPTITATQDLRIRIPAALNMTWDTSVTTATLGGGAAGKVSATGVTYEDSNKTAVLNVTSNFAAGDQVTIAGLKFTNFTAASSATSLQLVVSGTGGATAATDDKTVTITGGGAVSSQQVVSACVAPGVGGISLVASANAGITALGNLTISKPTGTVQDNVMVASIGFRVNSPGQYSTDVAIAAPSGWTLVRRLDNLNSTGSGLALYRKVAGASEPTSYAWGFSCINASGGNTCVSLGFNAAAGGILSFSGVDTVNPIDVENGASTSGPTTTPATPSVTTTAANAMLVTSHTIANSNLWANPPTSGMTQAFQRTTGGEMIQVSYATQASAGATGTKTATDLGGDAVDEGAAHILALRPATSITSLTLPSWTPQSGELLLLGVTWRDKVARTISGNGLTWTLIAERDNDRVAAIGSALYRASGTSPTAGSITIDLPGNTKPVYATAVRLSGVDTSVNQGIEAFATASGPAAADDANMKVTVTTVTANAMALAWGGHRGSATLGVPAGETIIDQSSSDCGSSGDRVRGAMWSEVVATPGPTELGQDNSLSNTHPWTVIGVSIKPSGGGAPTASTLSSAANQAFSVGQASTTASTLTVTDSSTPTITAAQNLRIRIPAALNMTWDTSVTSVTLGGAAAGKVSGSGVTYEDSGKTAVLNVTSNFAASDQVTIAGLKLNNFTATSSPTSLQLVVAGAGGATAATDDKTKSVVTVISLSSAANQTFIVGQAPVTASALTVTDGSTATITAAQDIRIRIPAALNMTWDTSVTTITVGGGAAGKVSTTGVTYEDSDKTVRLNVTSNFVAGDQVTIGGLNFANFSAASPATNLELVVAGSGGATAATDDKTKSIITVSSLSSAVSQTFAVSQAPAVASTMTVTDSSSATITATQDLRIRIPAALNMTWDPSVTTVTLGGGAAGKVSATGVTYENGNKTAVLNVTSDFASSDQLTIAGLTFTNFTAISAASSLELVVGGSGGTTAATDDKTIEIVAAAVVTPQESISACTATAGSPITFVAANQASAPAGSGAISFVAATQASAGSGGTGVTIGTIASNSAPGSNSTLDATGVNLSGRDGVLVFVSINNNSNQTVTGVKIDPSGANVTVPYLTDSNNLQSGGNDARVYVYGLANPPQGNYTVRATFSGALDSGAASHIVVYPLSGVDTASPFGTPGTSENDGAAASVTVPSASGEVVFAGMAAEYKGLSTVAAPAVEDRDLVSGGDSLATAHQDGASTSVTFNWSGGGAGDHWAAAGVSVKPAASPTLTIAKPTGTAQDDVMIASVAIRPNTSTVTAPSGWTLVRRIDSTSGTSNSLLVYRKVAGASEPGSYTWTLAAGHTGAAVGIASFSGVDTASPIDVENGATGFATYNPATPSVTTTVANAMLVASYAISNGDSWQNPPPSGMTQAFQSTGGAEMLQTNYALQASAGATGTKTATDLGPDAADGGNTHILALRPAAGAGTLTINKPTGTAQNNVMVASVAVRPSTVTVTPPSGWTLVRRINNTVSTTNSLVIYRKVAGASEPSSYTWTLSAHTGVAGGIATFDGVDTANPIDVENGQVWTGTVNTSAFDVTAPSINTTVANTMLVTSYAVSSSGTSGSAWSPPAGMTELADISSETGVSTGESIEMNYVVQGSVGGTGTKTATVAGHDDGDGSAHILALRPGTTTTSLTLPSWTPQSDELLLVGVVLRDETVVPTVSGNGLTWTQVADRDNDRAQMGVNLFRASGAFPTSGSITITLPGNAQPAYAVAVRLSNVDTTVNQGIEAIATASGPAGSDDANMKVTVTTVTANAMALAWGGQQGSATLSLPAGETVVLQSNTDCGSNPNQVRGHMWQETVATPGPTELGQDGSLSTAAPWAIIGVSIKPWNGPPATPVTLSSAANQVFLVGQPSTAAITLTVTDSTLPKVSAVQDIRIRIPAALNMTWDPTVTTATLGGAAAGKVSATGVTYEDSDKTVVLNVTSNFGSGEQLTISGLKFTNFTATSSATSLELVLSGAGGTTTAVDDKTIQIISVIMISSASSQTFNVGQASTTASTITVTDSSTPTITDPNNIRIRIPAALNMTWDTSVTTITRGGTASSKVSSTVTYEDSNKTVRINVTTDFAGGDVLTIAGLKFNNFTAASAGNLQLVVAGSGGATAAIDDKTKTINSAPPSVVPEESIESCVAPGSGTVTIGTIASASGDGSNTTVDVPNVNLSGSNAVVIFVGYNNDNYETVDSVVIDPGGGSQTSMGAALATVADDDDARIYVYGIVNPPQGTFTVRVTFSATLASNRGSNVVVYPLSGVDTSAPFRTAGTNSATSANGNVTVTSASGDLVLGGLAGETIGTSTVASPAVEDRDISGAPGTTTEHHLATAHQNGAATSVNFSWTHGSDHWAATGVSVKPGSTSTTSLVLPSWTPQAGELLLVGVSLRDESVVPTVSGNGLTWTQVADRDNDRGQMGVNLFRASGTSPTSGAITISLPGNADPAYAVAVRLSGVDTSTNQGIEAIATASSPNGADSSVDNDDMKVTVTTLTANAMALAWGGHRGSATLTPASGETIIKQSSADCGSSGDRMRGHMWQETVPTPGPTVLGQDNDLSGMHPWAVIGVSIKPLGTGNAPQAPGRFNAFEPTTVTGAATGVIRTKIAGNTVSLDIAALDLSRTAMDSTFTGTVRVELLDASNNSGALDGDGCRSSWNVIQTLSNSTFSAGDNGRRSITFTEANAYPDVRVRISYPTTSPTLIGCSSDNFAIRPSTLANFELSDGDWETAGTTRLLTSNGFGTVTHKAGRPLSVRASAVNGSGTSVTTNYAGAPTKWMSACAGSACTPTFGTLTLSTTFASGLLSSDVVSYSEVGAFSLQLVDSNFASVDTDDTVGDCGAYGRYVCSATIDFGRFVPDHFDVAYNTPAFTAACGSFTYMGQKFNYSTAPEITVTAKGYTNNTTGLYENSWWRITNTSLTGRAYTTASGSLDISGAPGTDPTISVTGGGTGKLTFSSGSGFFFPRTTPVAPFDAEIALEINVIDADGISYATNPARFGQASPTNGITFISGKPQRFGRLAISNANGSQLLPLFVPVEAQYWSGSAFVTNTLDSCSTVLSTDFAMSNYTGNLSGSPTCETAISGGGTLSSGRGTLILATPGVGNEGSVILTANLGATASGTTCTSQGGSTVSATTANLPHLLGNWNGGTYTENPSGRATFGVYKGSEEVIYMRENF